MKTRSFKLTNALISIGVGLVVIILGLIRTETDFTSIGEYYKSTCL